MANFVLHRVKSNGGVSMWKLQKAYKRKTNYKRLYGKQEESVY